MAMVQETAEKRIADALKLYEDGLSISKACAAVNLGGGEFYAALRHNPALMAEYEAIRSVRSHRLVDQCEDIMTDEPDPRMVRAKVDSGAKIAGLISPERYGQRLNMQVTEKVDLAGAIEAAKRRSLRPRCDPERLAQAEYVDITPTYIDAPPDSQSATPPAPVVDPFED